MMIALLRPRQEKDTMIFMIPKPLHHKQSWLWWIERSLMITGGVLIIVIVAAMLLGTRAKADLKAKYPPPGQRVDIGGYQLHINCLGTGSPRW
jgi:hypothetical protein